MPIVDGKPTSCGDCSETDPECRCCPWGVGKDGKALPPPAKPEE